MPFSHYCFFRKILKVMFRISPHWTLPISVALGSLVGMLASILPGKHTPEKHAANYIFSVFFDPAWGC